MRRILFALVLLAGCKNAHDPSSRGGTASAAPEKPTKPLDMTWTSDKEMHVDGATARVSGSGTDVNVDLEDFPRGTRYAVGDQKGITGDSIVIVTVDASKIVLAQKIDALANVDVDTGLSLSLVLPDGRGGDAKLPKLNFSYGLQELFKKAASSSVTFPGEATDPSPSDSLVYLTGLDWKVFGKAGTLAEVDYVALSSPGGDKGTKVCDGYQDDSGKPMPPITLHLKETLVTIYDRRTGKVVDKKTFDPDGDCPMFTFQNEGDNNTDSLPPDEAIEGWLTSKMKG